MYNNMELKEDPVMDRKDGKWKQQCFNTISDLIPHDIREDTNT
ncbi:11079_t:CDS:2 [Acaulospora colombiana]|uniref:11079_t:CDS:1 n=1 Tax=Acaulospora colombiana TaxID=27376 RepID=A0ACA9LQ19_9GLOM|nr:11079_t:CDS:2 [Acaulospora colombiana]